MRYILRNSPHSNSCAVFYTGDHFVFLSAQKDAQKLDPWHDVALVIPTIEMHAFIQWYLKECFNRTLFLPGTPEYTMYLQEIEEKRQVWEKQQAQHEEKPT